MEKDWTKVEIFTQKFENGSVKLAYQPALTQNLVPKVLLYPYMGFESLSHKTAKQEEDGSIQESETSEIAKIESTLTELSRRTGELGSPVTASDQMEDGSPLNEEEEQGLKDVISRLQGK